MIGVPVKVLHEAEGHIVTIETTSGEVAGLCSALALVLTEFGKRVSRITFIDSSGDLVS